MKIGFELNKKQLKSTNKSLEFSYFNVLKSYFHVRS